MNKYKTMIVKEYPPGCPSIREIGRIVVRVPIDSEFNPSIALYAALRLFRAGLQGPVIGVEAGDNERDFIEDRPPDSNEDDQPAWVTTRTAQSRALSQ